MKKMIPTEATAISAREKSRPLEKRGHLKVLHDLDVKKDLREKACGSGRL